MSCADLFLAFIAILFPPIAVWIKRGLCSADSLINILLCLLGYLPGLLHAWYIIAKYPEANLDSFEPTNESGRARALRPDGVTYYYISSQQQRLSPQGPQGQQRVSYGTAGDVAPSAAAHSVTPSKARTQAASGGQNGGESSNGTAPAPPSYADAVKGDHKIQSQE